LRAEERYCCTLAIPFPELLPYNNVAVPFSSEFKFSEPLLERVPDTVNCFAGSTVNEPELIVKFPGIV
jgi:hypothetical protein